MKKLLLAGVGLLSLCTLGSTTVKAGPDDYYREDYDSYRPRTVYRERYEERDYYPHRRVVVREYDAPSYYVDDCRPHYRHHHRPHVSFFLSVLPF